MNPSIEYDMSPSAELRKRIMIVDDDPFFPSFLKKGLERRGYEVVTAATAKAAADEIRHGAAQFFVFDLFLDEVEREYKKTSTSRLVNLLGKHLDPRKRPWVGLSGIDKKDPVFLFWKDMYGDQIRNKDVAQMKEIVDWIDQRFKKNTPHNWNVSVKYDVGQERLPLSQGSLQGAELRVVVEEALRLLIGKLSPVHELRVQPLRNQGHSATLKLQVIPKQPRGMSNWFVLKAGNYEEIDREYDGYRRAIFRHPFRHPVGLERPRKVRRYSVKAVLYDFVREARQLREDYEKCSSSADLDRLKVIVKKLFRETSRVWFENLYVQEDFLRTRTFEDLDQVSMKQALSTMLTGLGAGREDGGARFTVQYDGHEIKLFNPFDKGLEDPLGPWMQAISHGDLHSGNILVLAESDDPVLIDFAESRDDSIFRDSAKLEAHLALDLFPEAPSLSVVESLVTWQVDPKRLMIPVSDYEYSGSEWPPAKGLEIITLIRECLDEAIRTYLPPNHGSPERLRCGYYLSLCREYVRAWRWMSEFSPLKRLQNLVTVSRIIELYCCQSTHCKSANDP